MQILDNSFMFLVDADNLFFGARNQQACQDNPRIDFKILKEIALDGRSFGFSYFKVYASMRSGKPEQFANMLKRFGYYSRIDMRPTPSNPATRDMDVVLAVDAVTYRVDGCMPSVISVASGDADFLPVYTYLRSMGVRVEVVAFPECIAREVTANVDRVIRLDSRVTFNETAEAEATAAV